MHTCSKVWCGVRKENRPTASRGRVSYPQEVHVEGWSEVSTLFLYIGPLAQTTSDNILKTFPSSKLEWTLSRRRANSASTERSNSFTVTFQQNAFSKIHKSNSRKHYFSSGADIQVTNTQTDRHTHRKTTIVLCMHMN